MQTFAPLATSRLFRRYRLCALTTGLALVVAAGPTVADSLDGTVLAYDRVAKVLVLADKTTISLGRYEGELPDGLEAGRRVEIDYTANDDGIGMIQSVQLID